MPMLRIKIVRVTDRSWPFWVEAEFDDAFGRRHALADKLPILSTEGELKDCPWPGVVCCQVVSRSRDAQGRELVTITLEPDGVESTEGIAEFFVLASQLTDQ